MNSSDQPVRFGNLRLDRGRRLLRRNGIAVPLSFLLYRILETLIDAQGGVVSRAAFKQALWPNTSRIDTERRLNTAMRALREALDDDAERPRFIETLRGHGYRWIANEVGEAPQRTRSAMAWTIAACLTLMLLSSSVGMPGTPGPPARSGAEFARVAIAAEGGGPAGARALDAFIARHPDHPTARILQARLATSDWSRAPAPSTFERARLAVDAARRAVGDDPRLVTWAAELTLGGDWNWDGAEQLFRRAMATNADEASARRGLAWLYVNQGRNEDAVAEVGRMLAVEPTPDMRANLGWLLIRAERPDLAASLCNGETRHINLMACRHTALAQTGAIGEARQTAIDLMTILDAAPAAIAAVRDVAPAPGYRMFLSWRADHFPIGPGQWFQRAQLQAEAGRMDESLTSLQRAVAARDPLVVKIASTRAFAPLRDNPRFRALLRRVGPRDLA